MSPATVTLVSIFNVPDYVVIAGWKGKVTATPQGVNQKIPVSEDKYIGTSLR